MKDRVVVVTGAARGIGAETARQLLAAGARVALLDVDGVALDGTVRSLDPSGSRTAALTVDVTDRAALDASVTALVERWGRVDAVVHCAAIIVPGAIDTLAPDVLRRHVEVNLLGAMFVAQALVPLMKRQGRGHLVLVGSLGGYAPMPNEAPYCATKFGVRGFARALGLELRGTGVAVSLVCPDSVETDQLRTEARSAGTSMSFTSPPMPPAQVARAILGTLRQPRAEVLVPGARGALVKLITYSPWLFARIYPVLDAMGEKARRAYLRRLDEAPPTRPESR